jgi:hypothetical protein
MPAYRLTRQDAEAVVSYLRSLPAGADKKAGKGTTSVEPPNR